MNQPQAGILIISDRASAGQYEDQCAPLITDILTGQLNARIAQTRIIPDNLELIRDTLIAWTDQHHLDLILTSGGTGFSPRDVTPEATRMVLDKEAPGLIFAMLRDSLNVTPHAMLSRMVAGIRASTLIINLPGNPKAVRENLQTILPALPHALELLKNDPQANLHH